LRKQKTNEIIIAKRRRFFDKNHDNPSNDAEQYRGYRDFDNRPEEYEKRLKDIAPELFNEGLNSTIVSRNLSTNSMLFSVEKQDISVQNRSIFI